MFDLKALENDLTRAQIDIDTLLDTLTANKYIPDATRDHLMAQLGVAIKEYRTAAYNVKYAREYNDRRDTDNDVVPTCADYY